MNIHCCLNPDNSQVRPFSSLSLLNGNSFPIKNQTKGGGGGGEGRLTIDGSYLSHQRSRPSLPTAFARRLKQEKIPACHVKILPIKTKVTICLPIWRLGYHSRCPRSRHVSNETHRHWSSDSNSLGRGRRELEGSWWRHMPTRPGGSE